MAGPAIFRTNVSPHAIYVERSDIPTLLAFLEGKLRGDSWESFGGRPDVVAVPLDELPGDDQ